MSAATLNPKQLEAVQHKEGPLLVLAGAGSGKTRVLTQRIIHLLREHHVSPWNIFAVTFTNKAAREMKARVVRELGPAAQNLWISTFHSSGLRILRRHAEKIEYSSDFAVYDTTDQLNLIKSVISDLELNDKFYKPKTMLTHIDRAKNAGYTPENFPTEGDYYLTKISEIYFAYQKALKINQAMDFGDLILNVLELFKKHPEVLGEYQNQFQYLFVDEYQDTNPVQYCLISFLAQKYKNLFVVGDDDQSIYKFRGADIQIILNFAKDYPEAKVIRLEQNYRSTQKILNVANAVIRENEGRLGKELWTQNVSGEPIFLFEAEEEKQEAKFIVDQIQKKRDSFALSDVAIFYRTNAQSRNFEDELRKQKIPYKIFGGMKFYERAEIRDVLCYLRLLLNRSDSFALKRIINVPARGIGKTTFEKLIQAAQAQGISVWEVLSTPENPKWQLTFPKKTSAKLKSFVSLIEKLTRSQKELPLVEFLPYLYEQIGYWQILTEEKTFEAESRKENLMEFVNVVEEFVESSQDPSLSQFLDQVSLATDLDQLEDSDDFVTLMTVHLSKGLEFPVVFLTGLEEGLFPHARSLDRPEDMEEERRLCYVGMTRAKQGLFLTYARSRHLFGTPKYNFPSRFLENLPKDSVEKCHPLGSDTDIFHPEEDFEDYSQDEQQTLQAGQPVQHAVFGRGIIRSFEGQGEQLKVWVKFQNGLMKKLSWKHANLTMF